MSIYQRNGLLVADLAIVQHEDKEQLLRDLAELRLSAATLADTVQHNGDATEETKVLVTLFERVLERCKVQQTLVHGPLPRPRIPEPQYVEFRIDSDSAMPKKYGKKVKALGGTYAEARSGYDRQRAVKVPVTPEALDLGNKLLIEYPSGDEMWARIGLDAYYRDAPTFFHGKRKKVNPATPLQSVLDWYYREINRMIDQGDSTESS